MLAPPLPPLFRGEQFARWGEDARRHCGHGTEPPGRRLCDGRPRRVRRVREGPPPSQGLPVLTGFYGGDPEPATPCPGPILIVGSLTETGLAVASGAHASRSISS